MASRSIKWFRRGHGCDRQTPDRQTDHATEKCVVIGGIACAGAISPNNDDDNDINNDNNNTWHQLRPIDIDID